METRAGDPGAFAHFDLQRVDSPSFVVDAARLRENLSILADVRDRAGIKLLSADRKSTRLNSSHLDLSRMPSSA